MPPRDPVVERLDRLFRSHPAWRAAARHIAAGACSRVCFSHRPAQTWALVREADEEGSRLRAQPCPDPDFELCFSPGAVEALEAVEGDMTDFAIALFERVLDPDPERHVGLRILAPFPRLVRRGYVGLLLACGPRLVAFGARHGIADLGALRRLVRRLRTRRR